MIYTIGHSTRTAEEFLTLLQAHGVQQVADVRLIPGSRRHPQFSREHLEAFLADSQIVYRHFPDLGGRRKPRVDSVNTAWREDAFRGYADYMESLEFRQGLEALMSAAQAAITAVMCAEAVWWQCHRRLLADALLADGVPVQHILGLRTVKAHELSEFARVAQGRVTYPGLL